MPSGKSDRRQYYREYKNAKRARREEVNQRLREIRLADKFREQSIETTDTNESDSQSQKPKVQDGKSEENIGKSPFESILGSKYVLKVLPMPNIRGIKLMTLLAQTAFYSTELCFIHHECLSNTLCRPSCVDEARD